MSDIGGQRAGWVIKDLGSKIEINKRCSFTSIELINVMRGLLCRYTKLKKEHQNYSKTFCLSGKGQ